MQSDVNIRYFSIYSNLLVYFYILQNNFCYFSLFFNIATKTNTKTITVTVPDATTKCPTTIIISPPVTETITTTETLTIITTAACISSGSPYNFNNPGACCSQICIGNFG
ncbi:unnamed protein product [Rhizophagus irregularis]|nr:unnamed protein product [Rhizophagus irregularis]